MTEADKAADLPTDPTAFKPMKVTASKDIPVGFELEPIVKVITLDKSRIYQGWPREHNRHTDYDAAHATNSPVPIMNGSQISEYIGELYIKFFGTGHIGGTLAISYIGQTLTDDTLIAKGVVTDKQVEGDKVRLTLDLWLEKQNGQKVLVGTATGLAS